MLTSTLPNLATFAQILRDYQTHACRWAWLELFKKDRERCMLALPTGTGKGSAQLFLLREMLKAGYDAWILTPSLEVLRGYIERCGAVPDGNPDKLAEQGVAIRCTTPVRFRNRLGTKVDGVTYKAPDVFIIDEGHHTVEGNVVTDDLLGLCPKTKLCAWTATPFRATAKGTQDLQKLWGKPYEVLTVPQAIKLGGMVLPGLDVLPLLDDDVLQLRGGDFQVKSATKATECILDDLADKVCSFYNGDRWAQPTCITVPSTASAHALAALVCDKLGDRAGSVRSAAVLLQDTKTQDRAILYAACKAQFTAIIAVNVLSEGVDLPWLRVLIDAKPTKSPVRWLQQFGRICRPDTCDKGDALYVCCNRNLERFSWLLDGCLPAEYLAKLGAMFGAPTARKGERVLALERIGTYKPIPVHLLDGRVATMYNIQATNDAGTRQVAVFIIPGRRDPLVASRVNQRDPSDGRRQYGRFKPMEELPDMEGFGTSPDMRTLSQGQYKWWQGAAAKFGLDPRAEVDRRTFQALPVCRDCGWKLA